MESRWQLLGGGVGGGGIERKRKRTHGHGEQCGDCWGEGGIRGLNGNGKNIIKINFLKANESFSGDKIRRQH